MSNAGFTVVLTVIFMGMVAAAATVCVEQKALMWTEGSDFRLPYKLLESGALRRCSSPSKCTTLLRVQNGDVMICSDNVLWNNSTGDITLRNLKVNGTMELILEIRNSSGTTSTCYNLTVRVTPPGNKYLWLLLLLIPVLLLVLVFVGLAHFGLWKKAVGFIQSRINGGSAAGDPTRNGEEEENHML